MGARPNKQTNKQTEQQTETLPSPTQGWVWAWAEMRTDLVCSRGPLPFHSDGTGGLSGHRPDTHPPTHCGV